MAFTVEDGTGMDASNAFVDVAFVDDYFATRGVDSWGNLTVDQKQFAIVKATDYINFNFEFKGWKKKKYQALEFPREGIYEFEEVMPRPLLMATAEYSLRASQSELQPDPVYDSTGRSVKATTRKLEGLETRNEFSDYDGVVVIRAYPKADAMLEPLLISAGGVNFLTR